jgi:hypothetical protein
LTFESTKDREVHFLASGCVGGAELIRVHRSCLALKQTKGSEKALHSMPWFCFQVFLCILWWPYTWDFVDIWLLFVEGQICRRGRLGLALAAVEACLDYDFKCAMSRAADCLCVLWKTIYFWVQFFLGGPLNHTWNFPNGNFVLKPLFIFIFQIFQMIFKRFPFFFLFNACSSCLRLWGRPMSLWNVAAWLLPGCHTQRYGQY